MHGASTVAGLLQLITRPWSYGHSYRALAVHEYRLFYCLKHYNFGHRPRIKLKLFEKLKYQAGQTAKRARSAGVRASAKLVSLLASVRGESHLIHLNLLIDFIKA